MKREAWRSFRELDLAAGHGKGAAFRAFKALSATFREDEDYVVLAHDRDAEAIAALREQGRIYANSVNVVLVAPSLAAAILDALQKSPPA